METIESKINEKNCSLELHPSISHNFDNGFIITVTNEIGFLPSQLPKFSAHGPSALLVLTPCVLKPPPILP